MANVTPTPASPKGNTLKPVVPIAGPRLPHTEHASGPVIASEGASRTPSKAAGETAALSPAPASLGSDPSFAAGHYAYSGIDRAFKANLARLTLGLSPAVLAEQAFDWLVHLATSPGKQLELVEKWFDKTARFGSYAAQSVTHPGTPPCISPLPPDRRFEGELWQQWPYNLLYQSFLLTQQWW